MLDLEFPEHIPMDKGHQLDQSTARFQGVREGLPELVKNSKDQYARLSLTDREDRQIVVIINTKKRALGVLDFAGAQAGEFDGWQEWASRTAGRQEMAQDIEAGHGNGGKAFMVRGSTGESFIESCVGGKWTKMGFRNNDPAVRYKPAHVLREGGRIRDSPQPNPHVPLHASLSELGVRFAQLPAAARRVMAERQSYTLVCVGAVKDWHNRRTRTVRKLIRSLPLDLAAHAQTALTLETCSVWVMIDARVGSGEPLAVQHPEPLPGFDDLPPVPVPAQLRDPRTEEMVPTGSGTPQEKHLVLRTSEKRLRQTDDRKALNVIRVRNDRNIVANWAVAGLSPRAESGFIFGELRVPDLRGEHLADSHRTDLADTPLRRALEAWVHEQIEVLAERIQEAMAHETRPQDKERASHALSQLRELMREYLETDPIPGEDDDADGDGNNDNGEDGNGISGHGPRWGTTVDTIELEPSRARLALALGTKVPFVFRCYDTSSGASRRPVKHVALELQSNQDGIVEMMDDGCLRALAPGSTEVWLRDPDSGVISDRVLVESVPCSGLDMIAPREQLLKQGQRVKLETVFHTGTGPRDDLLIEGIVEEPDHGRLSRHGWFTAGMVAGSATLRVCYGPDLDDASLATIEIGTEIVERSGDSGGAGANIPHILLCGETAPGFEEYPEEQRTLHGGDRFPTIIEEPQFPHVVWFNHQSKESLRVRQARGGSRGVGRIATKTFNQFLALKCFDILKRLRVRQKLGERKDLTERDFTRELAQSETDCAGFIDAAYSVAETLLHQTVLEAKR